MVNRRKQTSRRFILELLGEESAIERIVPQAKVVYSTATKIIESARKKFAHICISSTGGKRMSNVQGLNVVIDLSHFNTITSFDEIKSAGIMGIIHKATQATNWSDPTYADRKQQATAAGLWWGAYHFGTNDDGAAQAQYFLSKVNPGPTDLLALDFEENPQIQMTIAQAEQIVTEVINQP